MSKGIWQEGVQNSFECRSKENKVLEQTIRTSAGDHTGGYHQLASTDAQTLPQSEKSTVMLMTSS